VRDRKLDDLSDWMKPRVFEFLARSVELGLAVFIVETLRTNAQHAVDVSAGRSWIARSKHQADADGKSNAIDIAPYESYLIHGEKKADWDPLDTIWPTLGSLGESLGLVWGGRWKQKDLGHFERPGAPANW
jgi:D-alanyl-D-alanine carboxypeptidase